MDKIINDSHRLETYESNKMSAASSRAATLVPVNTIEWPTTGFKQITQEHIELLPPINRDIITGYIRLRAAPDGRPNNDIKAMEKGQALVESERIKAMSMLLKESHIYISGICDSAYKKKVGNSGFFQLAIGG